MSDNASGYRRTLDYDALGRASTASTVPGTGNDEHHEKTTYDQYGRTFQVFDASRTSADFTHSGIRHVYNARGYRETLQDAAGTEDAQGNFTPGMVYRTVTAMDARGNVTGERLGNGVARSHRFDGETGRVLAIRSGLLTATDRQALAYTWDALGNLKTRTRGAVTETFAYDGLNRLTSHALGTQPARAVTYDGYGNIRTKTGAGTYAYGSDAGASPSGTAGPHAVASVSRPASGGGTTTVSYSYDANGNNVASTDGRTIAYTAFDKPASIVKGSHTTAFAYAPDRSRFKRTDTDAQGTTTTLYLGSVEKITRPGGLTQLKRHIGGVVIETTGPASGRCTAADATVTRYRLNDHLGSVDALLDQVGSQYQAMRFDPWGRRTDATTGSDLTDMAAMTFDHCATTRGFTNHEMLDEVGVIHMNGRIYDPSLARFLQADPYVQFPNNLQNHNRYSYVMNNPLSYTDPSGHFIFTLGAMIFAAQQGITMTTIAAIGAASFADALVQGASFEQALQSGFLSGISAAAFSGIGNVLGTHFGGSFAAGLSPTGFGLKVLAHGTVGGITSVLGGGKFGHGFASAGFTAFGTSINNSRHIGRLGFSPLRVAIGAAIGGTASRLTGGKFANGAVTGAFSQALNNEQTEQRMYEKVKTRLDALLTEYQDVVQAGNIDVLENIAKARKLSLYELGRRFSPGEEWDYKTNKALNDAGIDSARLAEFGNVHFGIVAAAYGIPAPMALSGAGATQTFLQQGGSIWQLVIPLGMVPPPEAGLSATFIDWDNYPWMSLEATERFVEGGGTFGDNPDDPAQILRGYKAFHGQ